MGDRAGSSPVIRSVIWIDQKDLSFFIIRSFLTYFNCWIEYCYSYSALLTAFVQNSIIKYKRNKEMLDIIINNTKKYIDTHDKLNRKNKGQFFTPVSIA